MDFKIIGTWLEKFKACRHNFQWPSRKQWGQFFDVASRREKYGFAFFTLLIITGLLSSGFYFYAGFTKVVPAYGGSLNIAVTGAPRFLNPVLTQLGAPDQDLNALVFSGLMKYDGQGNLINDAAEKYSIGDSGKIYEIFLRKNIKWHDGKTLTADDVIFTLQTIQNPDFHSPLRSLWQGIELEKIDDWSVRFKLKTPYAPFLQTLTFGIIPKHLWEGVSATSFSLHELNLKPVGSGPYAFNKYQKDSKGVVKSLELKTFNNYFAGRPYISTVVFKFYQSETDGYSAYKKGEIDAFSLVSAKNLTDLKNTNDLKIIPLSLPRYFAIFFNQSKNKILADKNVRQAIELGINKKEIIRQIFNNFGVAIDSPLLPGMIGYSNQLKAPDFSEAEAKKILTVNGWNDSDNDGFLEKAGQKLEFTLTTIDWPELSQTAQLIKKQLAVIGLKVNIDIKETLTIQTNVIKPRQYDALLFGEVVGQEPDLFHFWHSSQKSEAGLNLSLYENIEVDKLLSDALVDLNNDSRAQKYQQAAKNIINDLPAIFLFSPDYLFIVKPDVKGINLKNLDVPANIFSQINQWYLTTHRAWK